MEVLTGKQRLVEFIKGAVKDELDRVKEEQCQFREKMKSFISEQLNLMSIIIRHHECITQLYKRQNQVRKHLSSIPSGKISKKCICDTKQTIEELILSDDDGSDTPEEVKQQESFDQILGAVSQIVGCCQDKTQNVVVNLDNNNNPVLECEPTVILPPISSMQLWAQTQYTKPPVIHHPLNSEPSQSNTGHLIEDDQESSCVVMRKKAIVPTSSARLLCRNRSARSLTRGIHSKPSNIAKAKKNYAANNKTTAHGPTPKKLGPHKNTVRKFPAAKTTQTFLVGPPHIRGVEATVRCEKQPFMSTKPLSNSPPVPHQAVKTSNNPFPFSLYNHKTNLPKPPNQSVGVTNINNLNDDSHSKSIGTMLHQISPEQKLHQHLGAGEKQDNLPTIVKNNVTTIKLSDSVNNNNINSTNKLLQSPPVMFPSYEELMAGKLADVKQPQQQCFQQPHGKCS